MSLKIMYPPQKDSPTTFLLGDISATDTLIAVANAATLPQTMPYPLTIGIDKSVTETVMVTATNLGNNQLTITRGTPAYAWLAGSKLARVLTAKDFKDVQDNITDINTALVAAQGTLATQGTDVANLKTAVGNASSGLVKDLADEVTRAKAAEASEASRAAAAESVLTSGKINRTELAQVITDWTYSADGTQLLVTINRYNASTQQATQYTRTLPIVSSEDMGVMTPEAYNEIIALRNDVNTLTNLGGRFIGLSFATKAALTSYVVPASVKTGDFTYVLDDETKSGSTTRYVRNGTTWDFTFVIDYDPVGLANSATAGIVKSDSGSTDGKVFVETDGTMSVIGWNNVIKEGDERLNNARTPIAHKSSHATGQPDALSPGDIGAVSIGGSTNSNVVSFLEAETRDNIASEETHTTIMGKIKRWFTDLGTAAFKAVEYFAEAIHNHVVADISDFPTSFSPSAHKSSHAIGGSDRLTPEDIGAVSGDHTHTDTSISLTATPEAALGLTGSKYVSDAFMKLAGAALRSSTGTSLSSLVVGAEFTLKESGADVTFIKICDNYNGSGRTLVLRKYVVSDLIKFSNMDSGVAYYNGKELDTFCNITYLARLDSAVQSIISNVNIAYTANGGSTTVVTSARKCFSLSLTELNLVASNYHCNSEGTANSYFSSNAKRVATDAVGVSQNYWTRSLNNSGIGAAGVIQSDGTGNASYNTVYNQCVRPAFTLPADYIPNPSNKLVDMSDNEFVLPYARIKRGTYTGNGLYGSGSPNSLTFSFTPKILFIMTTSGVDGNRLIAVYNQASTFSWNYSEAGVFLTWGMTMSWHNASNASYQMNGSGVTYYYLAIG